MALPSGMRRPGPNGEVVVDAMSGAPACLDSGSLRSRLPCCLPGNPASATLRNESMPSYATRSRGRSDRNGRMARSPDQEPLAERIREIFAEDPTVATDSLWLRPSADAAVDPPSAWRGASARQVVSHHCVGRQRSRANRDVPKRQRPTLVAPWLGTDDGRVLARTDRRPGCPAGRCRRTNGLSPALSGRSCECRDRPVKRSI